MTTDSLPAAPGGGEAAAPVEVTIGIPTWRSADFIDRTLSHARGQTHGALRIVVSVDDADAQTLAICERHQAADPRVQVIAQQRRLGWSANANEVLARFGTPYGFLYFHDDIIAPDYVERLLAVLREQPGAASAHCDLVEFGLADHIRPAHAYDGSPARRAADFMLTRRGTTLRSMLRMTPAMRSLRFRPIAGDGPLVALLFQVEMLVVGAAAPLAAPLYRRWQRPGSLTRMPQWHAADWAQALEGHRQFAARVLPVLEEACRDDAAVLPALTHAAMLLQQQLLRTEEKRLGRTHCLDMAEIHPRYAGLAQPAGADVFTEWTAAPLEQVRRLEEAIRTGAAA